MKNFLILSFLIFCAASGRAQTGFVPHVVYDDNNKVYAVRISPNTFLKFIDSTGRFLTKNVTAGKDYVGKGHTARVVPPGQETKYDTRAEAQALLDYYNILRQAKEQSKVKPSHYGE